MKTARTTEIFVDKMLLFAFDRIYGIITSVREFANYNNAIKEAKKHKDYTIWNIPRREVWDCDEWEYVEGKKFLAKNHVYSDRSLIKIGDNVIIHSRKADPYMYRLKSPLTGVVERFFEFVVNGEKIINFRVLDNGVWSTNKLPVIYHYITEKHSGLYFPPPRTRKSWKRQSLKQRKVRK